MGMFDTVTSLDTEEENQFCTCADGHFIRSWQTKSMECDLHTFFIKKGQLYGPEQEPPDVADSPPERYEAVGQGILETITDRNFYPPSHFSGVIEVHTPCTKCESVVFAAAEDLTQHFAHSTSDMIRGVRPWISLQLIFKDGQLVDAIRNDKTRQVLKDELIGNGRTVFDESSDIYKRHNKRENDE